MITVRKSQDRGEFDHGWLDTKHTFSFSSYHDPRHMGVRSLRVINEDVVAPGEGFGTHPHRDMEIITYIVSGELEHRDSLGSGDVLHRGDVQAMSAGSGLTHSEFNPSPDTPVHLLQIWIIPAERGMKPTYAQTHFTDDAKHNRLAAIASSNDAPEALHIGQDAIVYASMLDSGSELRHPLTSGRAAWIQIVAGEIDVNGTKLSDGDGAAIENETELRIRATDASEFLLFDLA
ncbi:MAG: pirin family protein [Planctomycetota bacterium]|nr:pirin family protein [Planctomycetaceae bacterium]MDQ3330906.1 pirin family protein [Planctomycetota bacterium]